MESVKEIEKGKVEGVKEFSFFMAFLKRYL